MHTEAMEGNFGTILALANTLGQTFGVPFDQ